MIVVDLTVLMPFVAGVAGRSAAALVSARDPVWVVPPSWRLEACDWAVRHSRETAGSAHDAHTLLLTAEMLTRESHEELGLEAILEAAHETGSSVYQAVYALTARMIGAVLASPATP